MSARKQDDRQPNLLYRATTPSLLSLLLPSPPNLRANLINAPASSSHLPTFTPLPSYQIWLANTEFTLFPRSGYIAAFFRLRLSRNLTAPSYPLVYIPHSTLLPQCSLTRFRFCLYLDDRILRELSVSCVGNALPSLTPFATNSTPQIWFLGSLRLLGFAPNC